MVKANAQHDYYKDLEVSATADENEIKRQYFKLARLYHPDRNPGRVQEYTPKFQAIQEAHEILSDATQRAKYDADRARLARAATAFKTNVGGPTRRSAYAPYADYNAPPRRTQQAPNAPRPDFTPNKPSTGASRFANFPRPPPTAFPNTSTDARDRANAWQRMNQGMNQGARTSPGGERAWDSDADAAKRPPPTRPGAFGRSNTTKAPPFVRKTTGFDPRAAGNNDERQASGASAYFTQNRFTGQPPPASTTSAPRPSSERSNAEPMKPPDPFRGFRARSGSNIPFSEGNERQSHPYTTQSGEKTYFSSEELKRSSSVRDAPGLAREAERLSTPGTPSSRHRSASPGSRKSYFEHPPANMGGGFTHMGAHAAQQKMKAAKAGDPRRFFDIGYSSSEDSPDELLKSPTFGAPSSTIPKGRGTDGPRFFSNSQPQRTSQPSGNFAARKSVPNAAQGNGTADGKVPNAANASSPIFNIPTTDNSSTTPRQGQFKSKSDESIKFSSDEWKGPFEGNQNYFANPPTTEGRNRTPARGRTGRMASEAQTQPSSATTTQAPPMPNRSSQMPPPPPPQAKTRVKTPHFPPKPSEVKFSAEEWASMLKESTWAYPPAKSTSPTRTASIPGRKGSASSTSRSRQGSRSNPSATTKPTTIPKPATVSESHAEDAANGSTTGYDGSSSGDTSRNSDAMDIDEGPPPETNGTSAKVSPATSRVRDVPLQPQRSEWRDSTGARKQPSVPPTPTLLSTSQSPPATAGDSQDQSTINLDPLAKVAPFGTDTGAPGTGLSSVNELNTGLPVDSAVATNHPLKPNTPRTFQLPLLPKAPDPPTLARLTKSAWKEHLTRFSGYMRAWNSVEGQIMSHFETRRCESGNALLAAASSPGGLEAWLERAGEGKDEVGFATYLRGVREDEKVRQHWNVVCEKHKEAVEGFARLREKVVKSRLVEG